MYDKETFPNYLSGSGYVFTIDTAIKLYNASLEMPLLHLEDVYLTGELYFAIKSCYSIDLMTNFLLDRHLRQKSPDSANQFSFISLFILSNVVRM